jgi:hypothetical protein
MKIKKELQRKVLFALLMGVVTTGIISFTLVSVNVGHTEKFFAVWLKSWSIAYMVVIPAILIVGPRIQKVVEHIVPLEKV